jgi:hypothetical protein
MAKKLYVFGIGGTGSRVIKALTMLLASGCKLENDFDTVVPVIIDPDISNGDLNRTKEILKLYQEIRNRIDEPVDFFSQELKTISNLITNNEEVNGDSFQFQLENTSDSKFKDYIHYSSLSENDKQFVNELYSQSNLESDLNVGFKGNPNMGSIVLNQFTSSQDFQKFGQSFNPGDAIFIVNSIFGGTGAAGFPLLLKSLRNSPEIPNGAQVKASKIGGITYLPYFKLNKGEIDSDSFLEKAKAAIDYYNRTIIKQNKIDTIYFIGDNGSTSTYDNHVGEKEQKNNAHFLELAGALSIIDFCKNINNVGSGKTVVKEFGIEDNASPLTFNSLNAENSQDIALPLSKYKFFVDYLSGGLSKALGVSRWTVKQTQLKKDYFLKSPDFKNQIVKFNKMFDEWTNELAHNKPSFSPFNGVPRSKQDFKMLDLANCKRISKNQESSSKPHTQLIKLFGITTEEILVKK